MAGSAPPTVMFVVNWDWFFLSHRLPIARAVRDRGWRVVVAAVEAGYRERILAEGMEFLPLDLAPHGMSPLRDFRSIFSLRKLYRGVRPDIVHHVTIKPVLYGSIAASAVPATRVVNAVTGLGMMFGDTLKARGMRLLTNSLYRLALRRERSRTIFQNPDNLHYFIDQRLVEESRTILIRGSGVDCETFQVEPEPKGNPLVILSARLLWEKGIGEFVEAARIVQMRHPATRFAVVGGPDSGNPRSIPDSVLNQWRRENVVEFWGHCNDMPNVLRQASMVVLPTAYREGLPKALLEAAACGRPMIATNVSGCREIVRDGETGILVPPKDARAVAEAIIRLLEDPELRWRLGQTARQVAVREFSVPLIVEQTLGTYDELLTRWPAERSPPSAPRPSLAQRGTPDTVHSR